MNANGGGGGGGGGGDDVHTSSALTEWTYTLSQRYQYLLDKSTPYVLHRWVGFGVIFFIYLLRIFFVQGYYVITYGLGIYILQLFISFLSPQVDPEFQDECDPALPTHGSEEFRPFVRRLPEFKFCTILEFLLVVINNLIQAEVIVLVMGAMTTIQSLEEISLWGEVKTQIVVARSSAKAELRSSSWNLRVNMVEEIIGSLEDSHSSAYKTVL